MLPSYYNCDIWGDCSGPYLLWEVERRANTRSKQFTKKDMVNSLNNVGCEVRDHSISFLLYVRHNVPSNITEEEMVEIRKRVTSAISFVHPKAIRVFYGLVE